MLRLLLLKLWIYESMDKTVKYNQSFFQPVDDYPAWTFRYLKEDSTNTVLAEDSWIGHKGMEMVGNAAVQFTPLD